MLTFTLYDEAEIMVVQARDAPAIPVAGESIRIFHDGAGSPSVEYVVTRAEHVVSYGIWHCYVYGRKVVCKHEQARAPQTTEPQPATEEPAPPLPCTETYSLNVRVAHAPVREAHGFLFAKAGVAGHEQDVWLVQYLQQVQYGSNVSWHSVPGRDVEVICKITDFPEVLAPVATYPVPELEDAPLIAASPFVVPPAEPMTSDEIETFISALNLIGQGQRAEAHQSQFLRFYAARLMATLRAQGVYRRAEQAEARVAELEEEIKQGVVIPKSLFCAMNEVACTAKLPGAPDLKDCLWWLVKRIDELEAAKARVAELEATCEQLGNSEDVRAALRELQQEQQALCRPCEQRIKELEHKDTNSRRILEQYFDLYNRLDDILKEDGFPNEEAVAGFDNRDLQGRVIKALAATKARVAEWEEWKERQHVTAERTAAYVVGLEADKSLLDKMERIGRFQGILYFDLRRTINQTPLTVREAVSKMVDIPPVVDIQQTESRQESPE